MKKFLKKLSFVRSMLYKGARTLGDVNAVIRGKIGKRIGRRVVGRAMGRFMGKLFRKK